MGGMQLAPLLDPGGRAITGRSMTEDRDGRLDPSTVHQVSGPENPAAFARAHGSRADRPRGAAQSPGRHSRRRGDGAGRHARRNDREHQPAPGRRTATIESKTNFFAAIPKGDTARAVCVPLHRGRTTIVLETRITRGDGKLAAIVTQTQLVFEQKE